MHAGTRLLRSLSLSLIDVLLTGTLNSFPEPFVGTMNSIIVDRKCAQQNIGEAKQLRLLSYSADFCSLLRRILCSAQLQWSVS